MSWLKSPETVIPDMSRVNVSQRELLQKAITDQGRIGWHLAMRGYLSKFWGLAVSANHHLQDNNDKGEVWVWKTILHLWDFGHEMWEHQNAVLHSMPLESYGCGRLYFTFGTLDMRCGSIKMQCCTICH
jgi:hypothetical protein